MRVLQIAPPWFPVPPHRYGGTELVVSGLCDGLVAAGHDVTLVASGGSRTRATLRTVFDDPPSAWLGDTAVEATHALAGYRDRHHHDLIHDHTVVGAAIAAELDGPPVVHTVHGPWITQTAGLYRAIGDRLTIVAISDDHASRAPDGVEVGAVIHNGIDVTRYAWSDAPQGYLGWLGRAGPDKGADLAVTVAKRIGRPLRMGVKLNEPEEHRWWEAVMEPLLDGADAVVTINATHGEKVALLGGAEVLLFPISWDEPFGLVMAEANACGTPVVAYARGAAPEVLADGRTAVLVAPGDLDGFCAAVEVAARLDRRVCREHVERHFSARRMVERYLRLFDEVTSAGTRGYRPPPDGTETRGPPSAGVP